MKRIILSTLVLSLSGSAIAQTENLLGEELIPGVCGVQTISSDLSSQKSTILFKGEVLDPINEKPLMAKVVSNTSTGTKIKLEHFTTNNLAMADGSPISSSDISYHIKPVGGSAEDVKEGDERTYNANTQIMFLPKVDKSKSELQSTGSGFAEVRATLTVTCS